MDSFKPTKETERKRRCTEALFFLCGTAVVEIKGTKSSKPLETHYPALRELYKTHKWLVADVSSSSPKIIRLLFKHRQAAEAFLADEERQSLFNEEGVMLRFESTTTSPGRWAQSSESLALARPGFRMFSIRKLDPHDARFDPDSILDSFAGHGELWRSVVAFFPSHEHKEMGMYAKELYQTEIQALAELEAVDGDVTMRDVEEAGRVTPQKRPQPSEEHTPNSHTAQVKRLPSGPPAPATPSAPAAPPHQVQPSSPSSHFSGSSSALPPQQSTAAAAAQEQPIPPQPQLVPLQPPLPTAQPGSSPQTTAAGPSLPLPLLTPALPPQHQNPPDVNWREVRNWQPNVTVARMRDLRESLPPLPQPLQPFSAYPADGPFLQIMNGMSFPPKSAELVPFNHLTFPGSLLSPVFAVPPPNASSQSVWTPSLHDAPHPVRQFIGTAPVLSADIPIAFENVFRSIEAYYQPNFGQEAWRLTDVYGDGEEITDVTDGNRGRRRLSLKGARLVVGLVMGKQVGQVSGVVVRPSLASRGWTLEIVYRGVFTKEARREAVNRGNHWGRWKVKG